MDLDLKEASEYIGVPPMQLHNWTWAGVGPKSNNQYWKPRYLKADIDAWKAANPMLGKVIA